MMNAFAVFLLATDFVASVSGLDVTVSDNPAENVVSCNADERNCTISISGTCSTCPEIEYNCPTSNTTTCEFCHIQCSGSRVCESARINSNDCVDVSIDASGFGVLRYATINGPENGDLTINTLSSENQMMLDITITGPTNGSLTINTLSATGTMKDANITGTTNGDMTINVVGDDGLYDADIVGPSNGDLTINTDGYDSLSEVDITGPSNGDLTITVDGDNSLYDADIIGPLNGDMIIIVGQGSTTMELASITGPTGGDFNLTHYVGEQSLVLAEIDVSMASNAHIQILDVPDDQNNGGLLKINGTGMSGVLDITCGSNCNSLEVVCPSDSLLSPSCIIDCMDAVGCGSMRISTLQSHYYPIQVDCRDEPGLCSSSKIFCGDRECTMTLEDSEWNCIGECSTEMPTSNPSHNPSVSPTELPLSTDNSSTPQSDLASTTVASNSTEVGSGSENTDDTDASANPQQPATTEDDGSGSKDNDDETPDYSFIIAGIGVLIVGGVIVLFSFYMVKRYFDYRKKQLEMLTQATRAQNYQTNQMRPPQPVARPYNPQNTVPSSAMDRMAGRTENTRRGTGRGGYANRPSQSYSGQPVRPVGINARPPARQVRRGPQTGQPVRENRGDRDQNHDDQGVMDNIWNEIGRETPGGSGYL